MSTNDPIENDKSPTMTTKVHVFSRTQLILTNVFMILLAIITVVVGISFIKASELYALNSSEAGDILNPSRPSFIQNRSLGVYVSIEKFNYHRL